MRSSRSWPAASRSLSCARWGLRDGRSSPLGGCRAAGLAEQALFLTAHRSRGGRRQGRGRRLRHVRSGASGGRGRRISAACTPRRAADCSPLAPSATRAIMGRPRGSAPGTRGRCPDRARARRRAGARAGAARRRASGRAARAPRGGARRAVAPHGGGGGGRARRVRQSPRASARRLPARDHGASARERERLLEAADEAVRHADLWVSYGAEAKARRDRASPRRTRWREGPRGSRRARRRSAARTRSSARRRSCWRWRRRARAGWEAWRTARRSSRSRWRSSSRTARCASSPTRGSRWRARRAPTTSCAASSTAERADSERVAPARDWAPGDAGAARAAAWHAARVARSRCASSRGPSSRLPARRASARRRCSARCSASTPRPAATSSSTAPSSTTRPQVRVRGRSHGCRRSAPARRHARRERRRSERADADAHAALEPIGASHLARELEGARLGAGGRAVSGGERQWIALARAIATRQPVLLLDEPTSGLDAESQRRVLDGHRAPPRPAHRAHRDPPPRAAARWPTWSCAWRPREGGRPRSSSLTACGGVRPTAARAALRAHPRRAHRRVPRRRRRARAAAPHTVPAPVAALVDGCPDDMVAIDGYCIDRYEAPNVKGELPFALQTAYDGEAWCTERGKRLCTQDEWVRACEGPKGRLYPYGNAYRDGRVQRRQGLDPRSLEGAREVAARRRARRGDAPLPGRHERRARGVRLRGGRLRSDGQRRRVGAPVDAVAAPRLRPRAQGVLLGRLLQGAAPELRVHERRASRDVSHVRGRVPVLQQACNRGNVAAVKLAWRCRSLLWRLLPAEATVRAPSTWRRRPKTPAAVADAARDRSAGRRRAARAARCDRPRPVGRFRRDRRRPCVARARPRPSGPHKAGDVVTVQVGAKRARAGSPARGVDGRQVELQVQSLDASGVLTCGEAASPTRAPRPARGATSPSSCAPTGRCASLRPGGPIEIAGEHPAADPRALARGRARPVPPQVRRVRRGVGQRPLGTGVRRDAGGRRREVRGRRAVRARSGDARALTVSLRRRSTGSRVPARCEPPARASRPRRARTPPLVERRRAATRPERRLRGSPRSARPESTRGTSNASPRGGSPLATTWNRPRSWPAR